MRDILKRVCGGLLAGGLCLWTSASVDVAASVVVPLTLPQLVEAADLIVEASVEDVRVVPGPDGAERMVLVRGTAPWKGDTDGPVYVRLAGGRLGTTLTRVPGVPDVADGDRYVWFLVAHPRGGYSVVGLHQGALRVTTGADGTGRVLVPASSPGSRGDVARLPRPVADLRAQVQGLAAGVAQ